MWERLSRAEKDEVRLHYGAWTNSQFLHGEQGALVCSAKIVTTVPDIDSKFYAATQVMDEARHVEAYSRGKSTFVAEVLERDLLQRRGDGLPLEQRRWRRQLERGR